MQITDKPLLSNRFKRAGLPQSFIKNYAHGRRQIETADFWIQDRNTEAPIPIVAKNLFGQAACFPAEDKTIHGAKNPIVVMLISLGCEIQEASVG